MEEKFFYEKDKQIQVDYWSNQERGQLWATNQTAQIKTILMDLNCFKSNYVRYEKGNLGQHLLSDFTCKCCLIWQLTVSSVLIPSWQRFDWSVRWMRCIFPQSSLKRFFICMIRGVNNFSTAQFINWTPLFVWGAIYPFIVAKKRIFRADTSQVWVGSIWKHC